MRNDSARLDIGYAFIKRCQQVEPGCGRAKLVVGLWGQDNRHGPAIFDEYGRPSGTPGLS